MSSVVTRSAGHVLVALVGRGVDEKKNIGRAWGCVVEMLEENQREVA